MMQCSRCSLTLKEGAGIDFRGKTLCEDCYIYESNPPKACDPLAVSSALSVRKQLGQSGAEGLTEQQKKIYKIIKEKGKITKRNSLPASTLSSKCWKPNSLSCDTANSYVHTNKAAQFTSQNGNGTQIMQGQ
jgi:hypothetical protein